MKCHGIEKLTNINRYRHILRIRDSINIDRDRIEKKWHRLIPNHHALCTVIIPKQWSVDQDRCNNNNDNNYVAHCAPDETLTF